MPVTSIVISFSALVLMNLAVRYERVWLGMVVCGSLFFLCIPFLAVAVFLHGLFTMPVFAVILIPKYGRWMFIPLSILAMLLAYYVLINFAVSQNKRYERLRTEYPLESLEHRLPDKPKPAPNGDSTPTGNLVELESALEKSWSTSNAFERIHTLSVSKFIESPGNGISRMGENELMLATTLRRLPFKPVRQPFPPLPSDAHSGEILSSGALDPNLVGLHLNGVLDFVNPEGFGYVKSLSQVAGFRPHRFSEVPSKANWAVNSVELVGILMHDKPGVYLSEHLPRMDELKAAKTRPLDTFEAEGLAALDKGEDLFVRGKDDSARMMGAVRNATQCVKCHGGNRGDLLGAFSYRLRKW